MKLAGSTTMTAAVLVGPMKIEIQELPIPEVIAGSLLLRVEACSICGSDLRIRQSGNPRVKPPCVMGHEISGVVVGVGEGVTSFREGQRLCVGADIPCGACDHCLHGRANCCDVNYAIGYQYPGGFAQYVRLDPLVVSLGPVSAISDRLSFDHAALAEPLGCCLNGYERGWMRPGRSVVIFGAGPIGMMLALLAPSQGAQSVLIIEPDAARRTLASRLKGVDVLDPTTTEVVAETMRRTAGRGADMIFTACPVPEAQEQALQIVAKRGVINLFGGLSATSRPISVLSNLLHYREATLTGSHGATPEQHRKAVELLESGQVDLSALTTAHFDLRDLDQAFESALQKQIHKVIIKPNR